MPTHEGHCQDSLGKYSKRFDDLHGWMNLGKSWENIIECIDMSPSPHLKMQKKCSEILLTMLAWITSYLIGVNLYKGSSHQI
jgi:hypothetical protein